MNRIQGTNLKKVQIRKPRLLKACDVARMARNSVADNPETTPEMMLACIAKGFGFTHVSLSRLQVVESGLSIDKKAILPLIKSMVKLVEYLSANAKTLKEFLAPLLVILKKVLEIASRVDTIEPPQAEVDSLLPEGYCDCGKKAKQNANQILKK